MMPIRFLLTLILIFLRLSVARTNKPGGGGGQEPIRVDPPQQQHQLLEADIITTAAPQQPHITSQAQQHRWLSDHTIYDNWRRLIRRRVQVVPSQKVIDYEIVGQRSPDAAVLIFVWHTDTQTTTLIREYMPSRAAMGYGLAAGMVEHKHNGDAHAAARAELREECQLTAKRELLLLTPAEGVVLDKYCTTRMIVYLAIDPVPNREKVARDEAEEGMEVVDGLSLGDVLSILQDGELTVVASWAVLLALRKLSSLGYLDVESSDKGL